MNEDRLKGKAKEIKGDIKERIGGATKDRSTQAEGFIEEKKGKIQGGVGKVKEGVEREMNRDDARREEPEHEHER